MTLLKMYRRDEDGALLYREAWVDGAFFRHEGKVGTKGKLRNFAIGSKKRPEKPTEAEYFRDFRAEAEAEGFAELPEDGHAWVVLQVWTQSEDLSDPGDAWLLEEGRDALDNHLGWLGVGHVDGYDVGGAPPEGSGREGTVVNLFCIVADAAFGVKAVRAFVTRHELAPNCVIGAREPGPDSEYVLAWAPSKKITSFSL